MSCDLLIDLQKRCEFYRFSGIDKIRPGAAAFEKIHKSAVYRLDFRKLALIVQKVAKIDFRVCRNQERELILSTRSRRIGSLNSMR